MFRRIFTAVIASLVLAIGVPSFGAASQLPLGDDGTAPPDINAGLCVGASLDLSVQSQAQCVQQSQAQANSSQVTTPPANIGAGLCVGASLDFSIRSQAQCVRQNPNPATSSTSAQPSNSMSATGSSSPSSPSSSQPTAPSTTYAALGDSIPAGLGLGATDQAACARSVQAYPSLVAMANGLHLSSFACSGATAGDLTTPQQVNGMNIPPQLAQAFATSVPRLVTITAGANDVQWNMFLRKCFTSECGTATDTHLINSLIGEAQINLVAAFNQIQTRSNSMPPPVIITGYFNPVSQACATTNSGLTAAEINWITTELNNLNQAIQSAASGSRFVRFVPIDFTGHDICSSSPWVQSLSDPAPFHPNAAGQAAIAQAIH